VGRVNMKKRDYILALILTLTIIFAIKTNSTPCKCESIPAEIQTLKSTILGEIDTIEINRALLDRIDELTRLNERLEQENMAQKDYINGFEDKFWKE
jgi:hypothetical protein